VGTNCTPIDGQTSSIRVFKRDHCTSWFALGKTHSTTKHHLPSVDKSPFTTLRPNSKTIRAKSQPRPTLSGQLIVNSLGSSWWCPLRTFTISVPNAPISGPHATFPPSPWHWRLLSNAAAGLERADPSSTERTENQISFFVCRSKRKIGCDNIQGSPNSVRNRATHNFQACLRQF
jgi:hypothetical protein